MNVAIVQGRVKGDPDRRITQDGKLLVSFDVLAPRPEGAMSEVPISWLGAERLVPAIDDGMLITVVGSVLRRFYRTGGRTVSRSDVRADRVVRGIGTRAEAAMAQALAEHAPPGDV